MTQRIRLLPARSHLKRGEDIAAYLARTADANFLTLFELTGVLPRSRVWEDPPIDLLERVATLTGTSVQELERSTLRGAFPGIKPERPRNVRRYAAQPATCPQCGVKTVAARLIIVVLCPSCHCLLTDRLEPTPLDPPAALIKIQKEVIATIHRARECDRAASRLARLETLMVAQEPAFWTNFPPFIEGETPEWRESAAGFAQWVTETSGRVARPPSVTAALLLHCWAPSATPDRTKRRLIRSIITGDPAPWQQPLTSKHSLDREAARRDLDDLLNLNPPMGRVGERVGA